MHIAYLSSALSVHDERFLSKLVERGYRTTLITYYPGPLPPRIAALRGLDVVHRRPRVLARWNSRLFGFKAPGLRRRLAALRPRPDVLHSGYVWKDGFAAALSGFHPHLVMPWGSDVLIEPDRSRVLRWIVRYVLRRADRITCDCAAVADKIVALSGYPRDRIVVFPWGVDRTVFHPDVPPAAIRSERGWEDKLVLIMTRNFEPIYNVTGFVAALPDVLRMRTDVRVLMAGTGSQERLLKDLVHRLDLEETVHFLGQVSPARLAAYLRAADVYVSNSLSDGASLSLLEAMACGLPAVVTDVPALLEWIEPGVNGFVTPRGDSAALTRTLLDALADGGRERLSRMGAANAAVARRRADWERNFGTLEGIYRTLTVEARTR
jgi:glycosyltransferase involved in cell wall biosynthesis